MKTVIITGATSGIGEATALVFLHNSWNVIAVGRNEDKLEILSQKGIETYRMDITSEREVDGFVGYLVNSGKEVDVLVNNAGYGQFGTIEETSIEKARMQFETNVFGLASVTQKIIPLMRKNNGGRIINISSVAGITSMPGGGWYSASKFAVEAVSDALRWELKKFGIKVVIIEPGPIKTGFATAVGQNVVLGSDGPYGDLVKNLTTESTKSIKGGTVAGCAELIYKVSVKKVTKNRYIYTSTGKFIKFLLTVLPAKLIDRVVVRLFLRN